MGLLSFFSYNVTVEYKSSYLSKAALFILTTTFITALSPLVLVYRSKDFWIKSHTFYEQPDVRFKYQYLLIAESNEIEFSINCGSIPNIVNSNYNIDEECYLIQVREDDFNDDNKIDELNFIIRAKNPFRKNIYSIKVLLLIDYKIHKSCPLQMESLLLIENNVGLPISKHFASGNVKLSQAFSIPCWTNVKDVRYNYSVFHDYDESRTDDWLENILYKYSRRNVSTSLSNTYSNTYYGITDELEISISVAIGEDSIRYKPGIWQELKHFWIQYFSVAIIFYWILYKIKSYIFQNRLVPAYVKVPWKIKSF